ncbi:hypothetical protein B0H14DRAFT_1267699 [Mycena olivaceomarginata]|nr:hypothetical protein B0H14DRAFT_1267699 [Mycena olivaceomarginata]
MPLSCLCGFLGHGVSRCVGVVCTSVNLITITALDTALGHPSVACVVVLAVAAPEASVSSAPASTYPLSPHQTKDTPQLLVWLFRPSRLWKRRRRLHQCDLSTSTAPDKYALQPSVGSYRPSGLEMRRRRLHWCRHTPPVLLQTKVSQTDSIFGRFA